LVLRYYLNLAIANIATTLSLSPNSVKTHLQRASAGALPATASAATERAARTASDPLPPQDDEPPERVPPGAPFPPPDGCPPPLGAVVVSTPTTRETVYPPVALPVTVPSWLAPSSSPKTLSFCRLTRARLVTDSS
jgi:hypothetical protein